MNFENKRTPETIGYVKSKWKKEHEFYFIPYGCSITANTATLRATNDGVWHAESLRPNKRLYCEYCGCIAEKDHGTCEHCGAPLKEMDE